MPFEFRVNGRIARPVGEVFDAVVNPDKLSRYFVTLGGISGPLVAGATVSWWGEVPVEVEVVDPNERIVFRWDAMVAKGETPYRTRVEMRFQPLEDGSTMVTIAESGWRENEQGQKSSYLNCEGWSQMLACMKAWIEHGINLREGYYVGELSGKPALEPQV